MESKVLFLFTQEKVFLYVFWLCQELAFFFSPLKKPEHDRKMIETLGKGINEYVCTKSICDAINVDRFANSIYMPITSHKYLWWSFDSMSRKNAFILNNENCPTLKRFTKSEYLKSFNKQTVEIVCMHLNTSNNGVVAKERKKKIMVKNTHILIKIMVAPIKIEQDNKSSNIV